MSSLSAKVAILEKWSEFIRAGDRQGMSTVLAPDFVLYEDAGLPYGGVFRGVDGFLGMLANLQASWVDLKFEHLGFFDEPGGDSVAVHVRMSGRSPKTGEPMEAFTSEVFKI